MTDHFSRICWKTSQASLNCCKSRIASLIKGSMLIGAVIAIAGAVTTANAQTPDHKPPLRIIVPTAPGGVPDVLARIVAQQITQDSGRSVIVENRLGAGGLVALNSLANAPADGTSIVLMDSGNYAIAPHMSKTNPFDDVTPVALVATAPIFLCVSSNLGVASVKELIALAKAKPGMPYGSSGNGSSHHLAMEFFKSRAGVNLTHIPYKGAGQSVLAVISGEVSVAFLGMSTAVPQANAGKLKILAVASAQRSSLMPEIPSIAEADGPNSDVRVSLGMFANSRTPSVAIENLNREIGKAAGSAAIQAKFAQMGIEPADGKATPKQFAAMVKAEYDLYGQLVKALNLKID